MSPLSQPHEVTDRIVQQLNTCRRNRKIIDTLATEGVVTTRNCEATPSDCWHLPAGPRRDVQTELGKS
jgi:hypothetical protein